MSTSWMSPEDEDSLLSDGSPEEGYDKFDTPRPETGRADLEDLTVLDADDPTLGLTNIGGKPPEDWAADTGPTHSNEEMDEDTGAL